MIRQSQLIGNTVIDSERKHMLGKVRSFAVSLETGELLGFYYATNGVIRKRVFVPCSRIAGIGSGFITVDKPKTRVKAPKDTLDLTKRLEVVDPDGNDLGFAVDFFIDEEAPCGMCALEVSRGIFEDITSGRFTVGKFSRMEFSEKLIASLREGKQSERGVDT